MYQDQNSSNSLSPNLLISFADAPAVLSAGQQLVVYFDFNRSVSGFTASDIQLTGFRLVAGSFAQDPNNSTVYSVVLEALPGFQGNGTVSVAANSYSSALLGGSSATASTPVDAKGPVFTSSTTASALENVPVDGLVYTAAASDGGGVVTYSLRNSNNELVLNDGQFSINASNGQVRLASALDFETAASEQFTVVATDSFGNSTVRAVNLTVRNVNDAPIVNVQGTNNVFAEGDGAAIQGNAVTVFANAMVDTVDMPAQNINQIVITMAGRLDGINEVVTIGGYTVTLGGNSNMTGGDVRVNTVVASNGVVTFTITNTTGVALSAQGAADLINGITYKNTKVDDPSVGDRVFTLVSVRDTGGTTNGGKNLTVVNASSTITIAPTNDAPTAVNDNASVAENGVSSIDVLGNDIDPDTGDTLMVTGASLALPQEGVEVGFNASQVTVDTGNVFDYLAVGETATFNINYSIADTSGAVSSGVVVVTVIGANDNVVVDMVNSQSVGSVAEDVNLMQTKAGTILFSDVDLTDVHSASRVLMTSDNPEGLTSFGSFGLSAVSEMLNSAEGEVVWTYTLNNDAAQVLGEGEQITEVWRVTIVDGKGGSAFQDVTITITGKNDAIDIQAADISGAVTEQAEPELENIVQSQTGVISFADMDLRDVFSVQATPGGDGYFGSFTPVLDQTGKTVTWNFSVADADLDVLAEGDVATQTYLVAISDGTATDSVTVTVTITGTNDAPTVVASMGGAVTEDAMMVDLTTTVSASFNDVDLRDVLAYTTAADAGNTLGGTLTLLESDDSGIDGEGGSVSYTYSVANSATQYLAAGEEVTESFTITATDDEGATATATVTVTITGTNDAPTVVASMGGAVTEDAMVGSLGELTTTVEASFNDVDLRDVLEYTTEADMDNTLGGTLTLLESDDSGIDGEDGSVSYTYSVANSATQYLAAGEEVTESFTITATDDEGATATATVTVTITGTNDAPTVVASMGGAVTEDAMMVDLTTTVSASFNDVDLRDVLAYTTAADAGNTLGGTLTLLESDDSGIDGEDGSVSYTYSVANSATQYLAEGQTATETFTITATDDEGATASATVTVTITGTNDAPTVVASMGGAVTEDAMVGSLGELTTTVEASFNDVDLRDVLEYTTEADMDNTLGGTLTLLESDDSGDEADGSVSYTYSVANSATQYLAAGEEVTESFTITATDDEGATATATVTVTITGTNDAPTVVASMGGAVTEDAMVGSLGELTTTVEASFNDVDLRDVLEYTTEADMDNTLGGTLTLLESDDSGIDGEDGSVSYTYSVANSATQYLAEGQTATETFTITATDDEGATATATVTVTITGTNDAPTVVASMGGAVTEDAMVGSLGELTTTVEASFNDVDLRDVLAYTTAADAGNTLGGTLTLLESDDSGDEADGSVSYTYSVANSATQYLAAGEEVTESFTITATDDEGATASATVTVTITGTNDAPTVVASMGGAVTEDAMVGSLGELTTTVEASFNDVDLRDVLEYTTEADMDNTLGGTLTLLESDDSGDEADGSVSYTYSVANSATQYLAEGQTATETFTITATDDEGATASATVTVTITGTNDAPTVVASMGGAVTEDAMVGSLGELTTTVEASFNDVDLRDVLEYTTEADMDNTLGGTLTLLESDDSGDEADGSVSYTYSVANSATQYLAEGQTATETFTITATDDEGATATATVTVTITGTNDAPTVVASMGGAVTEDAMVGSLGELTTTVEASFNDVDLRDVLEYTTEADMDNTLGGTLTLLESDDSGDEADGSVSYTYSVANSATQYLAEGQTATETFTITATDDEGATATATVTVTITGTNDAPTVVASMGGAVTEDAMVGSLGELTTTVEASFNDVDLRDVLEYTTEADMDNTLGGTLTLLESDDSGDEADGSVSYTYSVANSATQYLAAGEEVTESFTITATDDEGATASATVTVTITGTNDAPTVVASMGGAVTEDAMVGSLGELTTTVEASFNDVDLRDVLEYTTEADMDNTLGGTLTLLESDDSGDEADGSVSYTYSVANSATQYLAAGEEVTESFTITATDDEGATATATVTVTITGTNDAPTVVASMGGAVTEDAMVGSLGELTTTVEASFNDVDLRDVLEYTTEADMDNTLGGTLTLLESDDSGDEADGSVSYTYSVANSATQYLAEGQTATETFTITATDDEGATASATVTVTITGTNDSPTILSGSAVAMAEVTENAEVNGVEVGSAQLSTGNTIVFEDVDLSDTHTVASEPNGLGYLGTFNVELADGVQEINWDFTVADAAVNFLAEGEELEQSYTVTVTDINGASATETVTITIVGSNDRPTLGVADNSGSVTEQMDPEVPGTVLTDSGSITFADDDVSDMHLVSFVPNAVTGYLGTFNAELDPMNAKKVNWTFDVNDSDVDFLALGQKLTQSYTITIDDQEGGTLTQTVTIEINGENDPPTVTAVTPVTATTFIEDIGLDGGAQPKGAQVAIVEVEFADVDKRDLIDVSVVAKATNTTDFGTILLNAENEAPNAVTGDVVFEYIFDNEAAQVLSEGQTVTETYTVTASDGIASDSQDVTFTFVGKNDGISIDMADLSGSVTEGSILLTETGVIDFTDVDLADVHTAEFTTGAMGYVGIFSTSVNQINDSVTWNFSVSESEINSLRADQSLTQTYTIHVTDGIVTVPQTVTLTIQGTNDKPVLTADTDSVKEAGVMNGGNIAEPGDAVATGNVLANDVDPDTGDTLTVSNANTFTGKYGTLVLEADGDYTYTLDNSKANSLAQGVMESEVFTYTVADNYTGTAESTLTITVNGTNDAPEIEAMGDTLGSVSEDDQLMDTGDFDAMDVDAGNQLTWSVQGGENAALEGTYGTFSVDQSGSWSFALDNTSSTVQALGGNVSVSENFTVVVTDEFGASDTETVTITVAGKNDAAIIAGNDTGAVMEAGGTNNGTINMPTASGQLTVNDVDTDESEFVAVTTSAASVKGYGSYTIDAVGNWSYTLDNDDSNVNALGNGETLSDSFVVQSLDGTEHTVNITINGANDAPVAVADRVFTNAATNTTFKVSGDWLTLNDTDAENDDLTVSAYANKSATLNVFTPGGSDIQMRLTNTNTGSFSYTVSDSDLTGESTVAVARSGANNAISGTSGNDILIDERGATVLNGMGGNDVFSIQGSTSASTIVELNTGDVLVVGATYRVNATVGMAGFTATALTTQDSQATNAAVLTTEGYHVDVSKAIVNGRGFNIVNSGSGAELTGSAGNDFVTSGNGVDSIDTGAGTDTITFANGSLIAGDLVDGGEGADAIAVLGNLAVGSSALDGVTNVESIDFANTSTGITLVTKDQLVAKDAQLEVIADSLTSGVFSFDGSAEQDGRFVITSGNANDLIVGGSGNDRIDSDGGQDVLTGGAGADQFVFAAGDTSISFTNIAGVISAKRDSITDFELSSPGVTGDELVLFGTGVVADSAAVNGADSATNRLVDGQRVRSHSIEDGIISFDDVDAYTEALTLDSETDIAAVVDYLQNQNFSTAGSTVAFKATLEGQEQTFVFVQGNNNGTDSQDVLIQLVGVDANQVSNVVGAAGTVLIS